MASNKYGRYAVKRQLALISHFGEELDEELLNQEALHLNNTAHAEKRYQDRAIDREVSLLVQLFGEPEAQKGGTELLRIPKDMLKRLRSAVDRVENVTIVVNSEQNKVITAFKQYKKVRTVSDY